VDFVTVGPALIANVDTNLRSEAVLAAVIDLAHGLGIQVVGRGVQTADQLSALRRLGCDLGQGSLFSPGLPHWEYGPMTGAGSTG
jgi:EAL domain-containing protein (putative c-di-GMP-specific phosphodiesterase class I)